MGTPKKRAYHTVVVGAGPAGVMAAREAAAAGEVLLVDSSAFPRRKSCGGMLNRSTVDFLGEIQALPDDLIVDPDCVRFRYVDWVRSREKRTSLEFVNTERVEFDEWLLSFVPDHVEVVEECALTALHDDGGTVKLTLGNGAGPVEVTASHVIGCDGARSFVRRHLGKGTSEAYVTVQDRVTLDAPMGPWFDCLAIPGVGDGHAYTYAVSKGDEALIGSVFYPHTRRPTDLQDVVMAAVRRARPEIGATVMREGGAALAVRRPSDVVRGSGLMLLAGEAAGFLSPTSGEGISYALRSGYLAGRAVAESVAGDALDRYRVATATLAADIRRRLKWLPLMESPAGRYVAGLMPASVVDRVTQGL